MHTVTLSALSDYLSAQGLANHIEGESELPISGVNTLQEAQPGEISFLSNSKYREQLAATQASAVIVGTDEEASGGQTLLRCADPYAGMAMAVQFIHGSRQHPQWGIDPRCDIDPSAELGDNANIGPFVSIAAEVRIGNNAIIYPGCYIGKGAQIGDDVILYPNVVVYDGSVLGNRVALHANTVVGQDGLGYASVDGRWVKIPQAGRAVVEDDVEMGANCSIDRATLGETRIGAGTKFSDQVVIGHGTKVGKHGMFVAQCGLAGSVHVGDNAIFGGQVGVAGHLHIGDNVTVGAKSGIWSDLESNERYFGSPAFKWKQFWRQVAAVQALPDTLRKLRRLENEVERLRARLDDNGG